MTQLGERLTAMMERRKISKKELADRTEISLSSLSCYLCGKRMPSVAVLIRLADVLSTTTDYLLGRSEAVEAMRTTADYQYIQERLTKLDPFRFQIATGVMRSTFEYLIDD